jgi:hypothetical protein
MKNFWNSIPEKRRPFAIGMLLTIPGAVILNCIVLSPEQVTAQLAANKAQAVQVAQATATQQAASDALQRENDLTNSVRSECWQFARRSVKDPSSLKMVQESWINGDVTSDFVVIQPVSAENSFGARTAATAVCSGNNGVITSYQMDG